MLPVKYDLPLSGNDFCQYYAPHNVYHPGIDLNKGSGDQDCGNEIRAPKAGVVEFVNKKIEDGHGFGIFVIIKHDDGSYTRYAHMQNTTCSQGQKIASNDLIGHVGKTGTSYCHLHFEVFNEALAKVQRTYAYPWCYYPVGKTKEWVAKNYLNPWEWLKSEPIIPEWAEAPIEKAKKSGIIVDWSNPFEVIGGEKLEWTLEKAGLLDPAKHEGRVTLLKWAMVMEKLGLLTN